MVVRLPIRSWRLIGMALVLALADTAVCAEPQTLVEASAEPITALVGQQVIVNVRALRPPNSDHGQLSEPRVAGADTALLGTVEVYSETRDGISYSVLHKRYAVVPRVEGPVKITGLVFRPTATDASHYSDDPTLTIKPHAQSASMAAGIELQVRHAPGSSRGRLPARDLRLEDRWSRAPAGLRVGDAVTRTVELSAEGVAASDLPDIDMPENPAYILHADQPDLRTDYLRDGMRARRTQRFVLLLVDGTEVPAIEVRWHDLAADKPGLARIASVALSAGPAPLPPRVVAERRLSEDDAGWRRELVLLATLLIAILGFLRWRQRRLRRSIRQLRRACRRNDAAGATQTLLAYGRLRWPVAAPLNLLELGARLGGRASRAMSMLDRRQYGPSGAWDGRACWRDIAPHLRARGPLAAASVVGNGWGPNRWRSRMSLSERELRGC